MPRFPRAPVPAAFVPIKLPCTRFPSALSPPMITPSLELPEIRFRAAGVVPPIVLLAELTKMPNTAFSSATVPAMFVPMKLPSTTLPDEPREISMPSPLLPEIRLHEPVQRPPGVVLALIFAAYVAARVLAQPGLVNVDEIADIPRSQRVTARLQ